VNTVAPSISGQATVGQVLSAATGTWTGTPAPSFGYQWKDCDTNGLNCAPIIAATASSYTVGSSDVGFTLMVVVTGTNPSGSTAASSAPTSVAAWLAPVTPILDTFNRANGAAGSNWSLIAPTGFAAMNVSGQTAVDSSTTKFAWNFWNAASFGPNVEAYCTISTAGADTFRIGARVTGGTASYTGYFASITGTGAWSIIRIDAGAPTTLASGVTQTLAAGDKIAIRIIGSRVTALHYTTAAQWSQVLSYDTAADTVKYTGAGRIATEFRAGAIDDFGGGSL
jgi:hypothetical protein